MEWKLVGLLAGLGLLVGVLSLFGLWPLWAEFVVWLVVGATWVAVLHFRVRSHFFWNGFATAAIGGMAAIMMQVLFTETYADSNPDIRASFGDASLGQIRFWLFLTGLAFSTAYAAIVGFGLWATFPRDVRARARGAKN